MPLTGTSHALKVPDDAGSVGGSAVSARFLYSGSLSLSNATPTTIPFATTDWNGAGVTLNADGSVTASSTATGKYAITAWAQTAGVTIPLKVSLVVTSGDSLDTVSESDGRAGTGNANLVQTGQPMGLHRLGTVAVQVTQYSGSTQTLSAASVSLVRIVAVTGMWDTFTRTVASGWGTADSGAVWSMFADPGADIRVNGSQGVLRDSNTQIGSYMTATAPMTSGASFTMTSRLYFDATDTILSFWQIGTGNFSMQMSVSVIPSTAANDGNISLNVTTVVPYAFAASTWYNIEWKYTASGTSSEFRIWLDSGTRPSSPTVSSTSAAFGGGNTLTVQDNNLSATSVAGQFIDYINFA